MGKIDKWNNEELLSCNNSYDKINKYKRKCEGIRNTYKSIKIKIYQH